MSDIFQQWMFEADGDPPEIDSGTEEASVDDNGPPDIDNDMGGEDGPPDLDADMGDMDPGFDDGSFDDGGGGFEDDGSDQGESEDDQNPENLNLPEKISAIMNNQLYQRYLSMLNSVGTQITQMTDNSDVLLSLMKDDYSDVLNVLKKLNENIRLWMKNNFIHEDYSKNLLFFNMCLNLLNLLNTSLDKKIKKGLRERTAE